MAEPGCLTVVLRRSRRNSMTTGGACPHAQLAGSLRDAFSLVELIGVLAIIVILAALLLPWIRNSQKTADTVQGVNRARVEEALAAIRAVKTAATEHCARHGSLASRNGVAIQVAGSYDHYDSILISEQLLDRPFSVRLGTRAVVRLVRVSGQPPSTRADGAGGFYDLDGRGNNSVAGAAYLLEAVISGGKQRRKP